MAVLCEPAYAGALKAVPALKNSLEAKLMGQGFTLHQETEVVAAGGDSLESSR